MMPLYGKNNDTSGKNNDTYKWQQQCCTSGKNNDVQVATTMMYATSGNNTVLQFMARTMIRTSGKNNDVQVATTMM